jgi:ankyrin repeat protein
MFSMELPERIIQVEFGAFRYCSSLRNVALARNTAAEMGAFEGCHDLLQIFDTERAIEISLQNRFNELPLHSSIYYISYYYPMALEGIRNIIIIGKIARIIGGNGIIDPTGLRQDCLGMTPLHILACPTVQCLELYQLLIDNYPANLIVEDAWGAIPLLYAVWGGASREIVQLLVNSNQSLHPNYEFDWNAMVVTLGLRASVAVIQNLLNVQHTLSPEYNIIWDQVLGELYVHTADAFWCSTAFCYFTRRSIENRINAIGVKEFRDAMNDEWEGNDDNFNGQLWHTETLTKIEYYESEYQRLEETTSLLELALWKIKLDDKNHDGKMGNCNKKLRIDQSEFRLRCRISCGADHVVQNVLPYLLPEF